MIKIKFLKTSIVIIIILLCVGGYILYKNNQGELITIKNNNKQIDMNAKTLTYNEITFTAPNNVGQSYYVTATNNGKILWEINKDIITGDQGNSPHQDEIVKLEIKNVKEDDLDTNSENFQQMKSYIGKPALWIEMSSARNPQTSWIFVDMQTGMTIGTMLLN
jgi:hypothetical protein